MAGVVAFTARARAAHREIGEHELRLAGRIAHDTADGSGDSIGDGDVRGVAISADAAEINHQGRPQGDINIVGTGYAINGDLSGAGNNVQWQDELPLAQGIGVDGVRPGDAIVDVQHGGDQLGVVWPTQLNGRGRLGKDVACS